jgi:hypothetical protein
MTTDALRQFITLVDTKFAAMFDEHGEIAPVWIALTAEGDTHVMPTISGFDKDVMTFLVRLFFDLHDVVAYVYVAEAWQLQAGEAEARGVIERGGISDHPDRIEVLVYSAEDGSGAMTGRRLITRTSGGKPQLGPLEIEQPSWSTGRMVGMLPQRGTAQ